MDVHTIGKLFEAPSPTPCLAFYVGRYHLFCSKRRSDLRHSAYEGHGRTPCPPDIYTIPKYIIQSCPITFLSKSRTGNFANTLYASVTLGFVVQRQPWASKCSCSLLHAFWSQRTTDANAARLWEGPCSVFTGVTN